MPANNKPGIDWKRIKGLFEAGMKPPSIASQLAEEGIKISRQAIGKRANKEGWQVRTVAVEGIEPPQLASKPTALPQPLVAPDKPLVSLTQEIEDALLANVQIGLSPKIAAHRIGVTESTLQAWTAGNPAFDTRLNQAAAEFAAKHIGNIVDASNRGDWKASQAMLQAHPATREEFGQRDKVQSGITLNFNFPRATTPPKEEDILDITPEEIGAAPYRP